MSHPTRESFRQFSNLDPQARLEEFQKKFDRLKSEFHNTPTRQMFESANRPYYDHSPHWTGAHGQDAQPANGHVPVEKTIPIQVQHERSRSEPMAAEASANNSSNNSATGHNNIPHDPRMHFMPDNSYFQHKFQSPFSEGGHPSMPNTGSGEGTSSGGEPRVHRIPIQVETRSATNPVPMGYSKSASSPSPTPSGGSGCGSNYVSSQGVPSQSNLHAQQQHPQQNPFISATSTSPSPFDSRSSSGRNIEIPIQIAKSSSSPAPSKKVDNTFQGAANSAAVNESASDPAIADPNQVYAMGYEPLAANSAPNNQTAEKSNEAGKKETPFDYVKEILEDLKNYESQVHEFSGTSPSDKGYRYLDEMLTLCILRLDCINIDGNDELRKYRKSAINEVNRVAAILENKVSKAADNTTAEKTPSQQNESQGQQQFSNGDVATQPNGSVAPPKQEDNQTTAAGAAITNIAEPAAATAEPKNKKEAKKLEKAKAKKEKEEKEKAKKEAATGEKKEGRRIILFRGKNKAKAATAQNSDEAAGGAAATLSSAEAMDLDTNNNDLKDGKDGGSTTGGSQSVSDQASETASSTTSSSTTLQGKETAV